MTEMIDLSWHDGPVIYATAAKDALRFEHTPRGWVGTFAVAGAPTVIGHDAAGHVWGVDYQGNATRDRGSEGSMGFRPKAIAFDAKDIPFVCGHEGDHGEVKLARRAGPKSAPWIIETLGVKDSLCKLAMTANGPVVALWGTHGVAIATRAGKTWAIEQLTATDAGVALATAPDGSLAAAFVDGTDLVVAHRGASWTKQVIARGVTKAPWQIALAFGPDGKAQVLFMTEPNNTLRYVVEGHEPVVVMDDAWIEALALVVDPSGVPHFAVNATYQTGALYAISPRAGSTHPRRWVDPLTALDGCAAHFERAVGAIGTDDATAGKQTRDCLAAPPRLADANRACDGGDRSACEVAGLLLVPGGGIGPESVTMHVPPCKANKGCYSHSERTSDQLDILAPVERDGPAAAMQFGRACQAGARAACMAVANLHHGGFADYAAACAPDLPMACAAAIAFGIDAPPPFADVKPVIVALDIACNATPASAEACNARAFIDEFGFAGLPKRDATKLHTRACGAGALDSCIALLLRKSAAPKGLDPDTIAGELDDACGSRGAKDDACTAFATALDTGWGGIPRDRDRAKQLRASAVEK